MSEGNISERAELAVSKRKIEVKRDMDRVRRYADNAYKRGRCWYWECSCGMSSRNSPSTRRFARTGAWRHAEKRHSESEPPTITALRGRAARRGLTLTYGFENGRGGWRVSKGYANAVITLYRSGSEANGYTWSRYDPCSHWTCSCVQRREPNPDYEGTGLMSRAEVAEFLKTIPTTAGTK